MQGAVMEFQFVKEQLGLSFLKPIRGGRGGGCVCQGQGFDSDRGQLYLKWSDDVGNEAREMLSGERASLQTIQDTDTVRCPRPLGVAADPASGRVVLVTEFLHMGGLRGRAAQLGEQIARMHLHNGAALAKEEAHSSRVGASQKHAAAPVSQFGFPVPTCCGRIPQANQWCDDWVQFLARDKLEPQIAMIEREYGDREARELWPRLQRCLPEMFRNITVTPALLHGDLWSGNAAETDDEPVVFDPSSFYGHAEYELGIGHMFGGLGSGFFRGYHAVLPKQEGFERRNRLYQLFHNLNHWNHFGSGYRGSSLSLMRSLVSGS
ncbi:ketosamine-3-kinase-like isoform X1 [Amphibalanus amphitrite]|uniref:ketosamine-3-kinase-like isoform X1 n=2 Tax=Amphibalanus amphitrite TaxID=1232801 RepID=UPI001C91400B|nr:ketosamine-3-kinase-like isoform X1 [Amphibalanus amphitrite]